VTAAKEPADPATLPLPVTAVPESLLKDAGITFVSDAGIFSPNTYFTEFTARKLSNPRIRGIGAGPANPGVVTYIDGVPSSTRTHQVSTSSTSARSNSSEVPKARCSDETPSAGSSTSRAPGHR
jgi:TonB-dependent Receptor Plug Domain